MLPRITERFALPSEMIMLRFCRQIQPFLGKKELHILHALIVNLLLEKLLA
jgi:hypothetical protein